MRSSFPIFAATAFAAMFALTPTALTARGGPALCQLVEADAVSPARNWLGNLHGWSDSPLVMSWRAFVAQTKGREPPSGCEH